MSDLLTRAKEIKNATEIGENTAERVGGVMVDTVNAITSLQERAVNHEDTLTTHGKQITALQNKGQNMEYDIEQQQGVLNSQGTRLTEVEHRADEHDTQIAQINTDMKQMDDNILRHGEEIEDLQDEMNTKQQELTLTVLDNGNIRIGNLQGQTKDFMPATPSGDPMHYAYEAIGAVWNGGDKDIVYDGTIGAKPYFSEWGDSYTHKSKRWLLNEIGDLTNSDMRNILMSRPPVAPSMPLAQSLLGKNRTNRAEFNILFNAFIGNFDSYAANANNIEVLKITNTDVVKIKSLNYAFAPAQNIKKILNKLVMENVEYTPYGFYSNDNLEFVRLSGLSNNITLRGAPKLNKYSIIYLIDNEQGSKTKNIELHPTCYNNIINDADVQKALSNHPLVTISSYGG